MSEYDLLSRDLKKLTPDELIQRAGLRNRQVLENPLNRRIVETASADLEAISVRRGELDEAMKKGQHLKLVKSE
jgi:hypothetical protein